MTSTKRNSIEFKVWGRYALFTDPISKLGGEKCSYHTPTYEGLKGIVKSIYWKPTLVWVIDQVRVLRRIRTQTKGTKPVEFAGGNTLAIYTYLADVEYQVSAHFEWNMHRRNLAQDQNEGKHLAIAKRMLDRGGRYDVFLGVRDCQAYVEPCDFGSGTGHYDGAGELTFGLMFHGFDYPDESGGGELVARFWRQTMVDGVITFLEPQACDVRKSVRPMSVKVFGMDKSMRDVNAEFADLEF